MTWQRFRPSWQCKDLPLCYRAVVVRRVIGHDGKPVLRKVGYVGTYDETRLAEPKMQQQFWKCARFCLGKLHLAPNAIALIERALAQRVTRP